MLDWSNEWKKMAGIYNSTKLMLAASCAEDSDGHMFYTPSKSKIGIKLEGLEKFGVIDDIFLSASSVGSISPSQKGLGISRTVTLSALSALLASRVDLGMQHRNLLSTI